MADLQTHLAEFGELDASVIALSADPAEGAAEIVAELGLDYRVLSDLDVEATAGAIGCYTAETMGPAHVQPAGFVLDRDGSVVHAVYSSGKVGRLTAEDALVMLRGLV